MRVSQCVLLLLLLLLLLMMSRQTNMAKAALNMMTRTSAQDYVKSNIYMTSVDTGASSSSYVPLAFSVMVTVIYICVRMDQ